jgi:isopenicillin N synthase-like dioxygenase
MAELVPTVDLSRPIEAAAAALDAACRTIGFMQVVGHGVPDAVIARFVAAATAFFDLPLDEKRSCVPADKQQNRGYAELGSEALSYSLGVDTPPDLFEAFNIGVDEWPAHNPYYEAERDRTFAPNIWPARPAGMRAAYVEYFAAVEQVAHRLTSTMAVALDLPRDFFAAATDRSVNTLRSINYERRPGEPDPVEGQMRMGAHTDYGILTLLHADPVPGLQIVGPDGQWHDVQPAPDAFLVNLGDAIAVWTNDRYRSTLHRVVPPPRSPDGRVRRRSFAFFHDGNLDAVMECLPSCTDATHPPKYAPITIGDHLLAKIMGPRAMAKPEGVVQTRTL